MVKNGETTTLEYGYELPSFSVIKYRNLNTKNKAKSIYYVAKYFFLDL